MITRRSAFLMIPILLAACASGSTPEAATPAPDHHVDPAGTYDLIVDMNGMLISAVMIIQGDVREGWTGTIDSDAGAATVTDIRVDGHSMTFNIPEAQAEVQLRIDGKMVRGEMTGGMGQATINGEKR